MSIQSDEWDEPLPYSSVTPEDSEAEEQPSDERKMDMLDGLLKEYVERMAYRPVVPLPARERTQSLAKPKKLTLMDNDTLYYNVYDPRMRGERVRQLAGKYRAISTEQLEFIIRSQSVKEQKKEGLLKKKQVIYHSLLTKLERQCRTQYLNVLIKKFAKFIANHATTMPIPPNLVEPYSRMQRGIFCNILLAIGIQPSEEPQMYEFYATQEAQKYEICHKLAHALLSFIIKALDAAAIKNMAEVPQFETDFVMDNYIKDRLMCAAEKKILNARYLQKSPGLKSCRKYKSCMDF